MRYIYAVLTCLTLSSCATNPYTQYYTGATNARTELNYVHSGEQIRIVPSDNIDADTKKLMAKGYTPIGRSTFNAHSNKVNDNQVLAQAELIGAQIVLTASKYTNTESGAVPITVPNVTTSNSSASATAYGNKGSVTAYGTGTTTTYGSNTVYMPYNIRRADFFALYFAKTKSIVGAYTEPLSDEMKQKLQSNSGVKVFLVAEDTPAFDANILPGDVLLTFNGIPIRSVENYQELIKQDGGTPIKLTIYRDGKVIKKVITPNSL